jgi:hypothetical protein
MTAGIVFEDLRMQILYGLTNARCRNSLCNSERGLGGGTTFRLELVGDEKCILSEDTLEREIQPVLPQ